MLKVQSYEEERRGKPGGNAIRKNMCSLSVGAGRGGLQHKAMDGDIMYATYSMHFSIVTYLTCVCYFKMEDHCGRTGDKERREGRQKVG